MPLKSFKKVNERRCELIDKKFNGGLTDEEALELKIVKEWVADWIQKRCPRDTAACDDAEKRLDEIKARIQAKKEASQ